MATEPPQIAPAKALLNALGRTSSPVAFLVGSPMSMPERGAAPGSPGVPGVAGIVELVRSELGRDSGILPEFDKALASADPATRYQAAMGFLRSWTSQDTVNKVIRQAVRRARVDADSDARRTNEEIEKDLGGWFLPKGINELAALVAQDSGKFTGPILTTNFDPLLSIGLKLNGAIPVRTVLGMDGQLHTTDVSDKKARQVVHLHGDWLRSDTLHTPDQLKAERPYLSASLRNLLQGHTLAVVAYGGWDDVFTKTLADLTFDSQAQFDVVWAFFESDPIEIAVRYAALLERTKGAWIRGRFRMYGGINCHEFFGELRKNHLGTVSGTPRSSSLPPVPDELPSPRASLSSPATASHPPSVVSFSPSLVPGTKPLERNEHVSLAAIPTEDVKRPAPFSAPVAVSGSRKVSKETSASRNDASKRQKGLPFVVLALVGLGIVCWRQSNEPEFRKPIVVPVPRAPVKSPSPNLKDRVRTEFSHSSSQ